MKVFSLLGSVRILRAGALALLCTASYVTLPWADAMAATWQWSALQGRERLVIELDGTEGEKSLSRTGTHTLSLGLSQPPAQFSLSGNAPGATNMVSNAVVRGNEIELSLKNAAFGYVVTRPSARKIVVDVFRDPLGARWTPSGRLAPAAPAAVLNPAPSASALPLLSAPTAVTGAPAVPSPAVSAPVVSARGKPAPAGSAAATSPVQALSSAQAPSSAQAARAVQAAPSPGNPAPRAAASSALQERPLPEMPSSGALREIPLPESPSVAAGAQPTTPKAGDDGDNFLTRLFKEVLSLNAHAAKNGAQADEGGRGRILSPQNIRASVNSDGPEAWGSEDSLSTSLPVAGSVAVPTPMPVASPPPALPASPSGMNGSALPAVSPVSPAASSSATGATAASRARGNEIRQAITPPDADQGLPPPPGAQKATAQNVQASPQNLAESNGQPSATPVQPATAVQPATPVQPAASTQTAGDGASPSSQALSPSATPSAPSSGGAVSPAGQPAIAKGTTPALPGAKGQNPDSQPQTMAETRQAAQGPKGGNATAQTNATRPVVYVNEKGEPVPKPPEPDKMLAEAEGLIDKNQNLEALPILQELKDLPLSAPMHEKVLYHISDVVAAIHAGKPLEGFDPIVGAASEAMNANLRSPRVPDSLFRLGTAHLDVGNLSEAEGYFKALKRRFPYDINVPLAFKNLGIAQLKAGKSQQAVDTLQIIMQEYPESSVLRDAAVGLARALYAVNDLDKMAIITDFIDKRWPRYYVQDQDYLLMLADSQARMNRLESALQHYWLYYNLVPEKAGNDMVLANIGDLYLRTGRLAPAKELFTDIRKRYPGSDGAAIALLRLAEQGIHDTPITIDEMFRVFVLPGDPKPYTAYNDLQREYPKDSRSIVAGLKLAMLQLWNKEYTDAMGTAANFIDSYPEHTDVEQARLVILRAFAEELKNALAEENYGRILILWNGFPLVRERYGDMDANMRHALARGYIERGDDDMALEMLSEFLKSPKHPVYSDYTFTLFFNRYLQAGDWNGLLDLGELVQNWDMAADMRSQLDYALALSAENLGLASKALPLWQKLAERTDIPLYEQAYATYFLAKDAERRRDIKAAYKYNKDTLALFQRLQEERSDRADPDRIKEAIGSLMDITEVGNHIPEALEWVERYNEYAPESSPEYAGLRFREARLYRKLGDSSKAKALLEQIVAKEADSAFGKAAASELRTFEVSRDLRNFMQGGGENK